MNGKPDQEEKELLASYDKGDWVSEPKNEKLRIVAIAANSIQKNKRVNIQLTETDLNQLKARAAQEGLSYQTLISSIVHKYVSGRLTDSQ